MSDFNLFGALEGQLSHFRIINRPICRCGSIRSIFFVYLILLIACASFSSHVALPESLAGPRRVVGVPVVA